DSARAKHHEQPASRGRRGARQEAEDGTESDGKRGGGGGGVGERVGGSRDGAARGERQASADDDVGQGRGVHLLRQQRALGRRLSQAQEGRGQRQVGDAG